MDSYVVCDTIIGSMGINNDSVVCESFAEVFKYGSDGRLSQYDYIKSSRVDNIITVTFVYSADGYVIKELLSSQEGRGGALEYTDLEFDHHGNWIRQRGSDGIEVKRVITYWDE